MQKSGFYDMHAHILPGVDDGAINSDITQRMLVQAYEQGIRTIFATPHFYAHKEYSVEKIITSYKKVLDISRKKYSDLNIILGNEILYNENIINQLENKDAFTLGASRYILVEFNPEVSYKTLYTGIRKIVESMYIPILAHVERYTHLFKAYDKINELTALGCYMQLNTGDLTGNLFNKWTSYCRNLVAKGYIHLLGSDCHNDVCRSPIMLDAINLIANKVDNNILSKIIYENPRKVLENQYIEW